jgi:hypothetical protein
MKMGGAAAHFHAFIIFELTILRLPSVNIKFGMFHVS